MVGNSVVSLNIWGPSGLTTRVINLDGFPDVVSYVFDPQGSRVQRADSYGFTYNQQPAISNELYDAYGKLMYWSDVSGGGVAPAITDDPFAYKARRATTRTRRVKRSFGRPPMRTTTTGRFRAG